MSHKEKKHDPAPQPDAPQTPAPKEESQSPTDALKKEIAELTDKLQRLSADYANYQKRVPRQIADSVAYEKKNIIRALLPAIDNFAHALAGAENAKGPEAMDSIIKGVKYIFDHMLDALKTQGVERIASVGQPFDPNRHEAMMQKAEPDKPDNIVLEEYLAGFMLNGQTLRPAKVIINKLPAAAPETPAANTTPPTAEETGQ